MGIKHKDYLPDFFGTIILSGYLVNSPEVKKFHPSTITNHLRETGISRQYGFLFIQQQNNIILAHTHFHFSFVDDSGE